MADFAPDLTPLLVTLPDSVGVYRTPEAIKVRYPRYIDAVQLFYAFSVPSSAMALAVSWLFGPSSWDGTAALVVGLGSVWGVWWLARHGGRARHGSGDALMLDNPGRSHTSRTRRACGCSSACLLCAASLRCRLSL